MSEALNYQEMSRGEVNNGHLGLLDSLEKADRDVALDIANYIWIDDEFESNVHTDFKYTLSEYYSRARAGFLLVQQVHHVHPISLESLLLRDRIEGPYYRQLYLPLDTRLESQ